MELERIAVVAGASAGFSLAFLALFDAGDLIENPDIRMVIEAVSRTADGSLEVDQRGNDRPADAPCDIGAVERR